MRYLLTAFTYAMVQIGHSCSKRSALYEITYKYESKTRIFYIRCLNIKAPKIGAKVNFFIARTNKFCIGFLYFFLQHQNIEQKHKK